MRLWLVVGLGCLGFVGGDLIWRGAAGKLVLSLDCLFQAACRKDEKWLPGWTYWVRSEENNWLR